MKTSCWGAGQGRGVLGRWEAMVCVGVGMMPCIWKVLSNEELTP